MLSVRLRNKAEPNRVVPTGRQDKRQLAGSLHPLTAIAFELKDYARALKTGTFRPTIDVNPVHHHNHNSPARGVGPGSDEEEVRLSQLVNGSEYRKRLRGIRACPVDVVSYQLAARVKQECGLCGCCGGT